MSDDVFLIPADRAVICQMENDHFSDIMPKIMEESQNNLEIEYGPEFHYQKFRYETEKRTGKKQHLKPMMSVKGLPNNSHEFCVYIFCVSPNEPYSVHPNKLVGKDCYNGVYHTTDVKIKKNDDGDSFLEIPYLYICRTKKNAVKKSLKKMLDHLPISVKEKINTCNDDNVKTDSIRLRIMLEIDGKEYNQLTSIITHHDSGEKVKLNIIELSRNTFTSEDQSNVALCTEESIGPDIKPGEFEVQIITDNWKSEPYILQNGDILYKRRITYAVPECQDRCIKTGDVKGKILLRCRINDITCERDIVFIQSKLHKKRKVLNERQFDFKRPRLDRGQSHSEISQDSCIQASIDRPTSESPNNNSETATSDSDSYTLLQNNGGKTFVPMSEKSTFEPASDSVPLTLDSHQPTLEFVTPAFPADSLSIDSGKGSAGAQEMDSDSSLLYLSPNNYTSDNNLPPGSQSTSSVLTELDLSATSQAGSSFGKVGHQIQNDSSYAVPSTSYRPLVEPVTPDVIPDIILKSAQMSDIPTSSAQDINHVKEQSSQKEVQIHPVTTVSIDMKKSGTPPGSSMNLLPSVNFDSINVNSIDLMNLCQGMLKIAESDYQGGPTKPMK